MIAFLVVSALAAPPTELQQHMQGHFADATDAMWFTAAGDLPKAKEKAGALDHPAPGTLPLELQPLADALRSATQTLAAAENLAAAAEQVGQLSMRCAACHQAAKDKGPKVAEDQVKHLGDKGPSHLWGVYGLWVSLVLPDEKGWPDAVALLDSERVAAHPRAADAKEMTASFEQLRVGALAATTPQERAQAFSKLLTTCAGCHAALEVEL